LTPKQEERRVALLKEALALPEEPGVYIMRDAGDKIIYVGKSRHLRDRVSQ
jgi:excinuclease ABC subunit C